MPGVLTCAKAAEVAGLKSVWWPASSRNGGRDQIGTGGRIKSESAVRKTCGRQRTPEQRIKLKDERHLLHHRKAELTDGEREKVNAWLWEFPLLRKAYNAKEKITDAYDAPNRREGESAIVKAIQAIPPEIDKAFGEMTTAYKNWRTPILNYFEEPATNAYTESVNSLIRELDRVGRGYSFDTMRALMLFDETVRVKKTSTRHQRPSIPDDAFGFIDMDSLDDLDDLWGDQKGDTVDGPDIGRLLARLALDDTVEDRDVEE